MTAKLTKKQKGFVKDYLETGNGTQAALGNYNTESTNTAAVIATENLRKPNVVEAIRNGQKDDQIADAFNKLINLKRLDYFVFAKSMTDEEIHAHVESVGLTCVNVRPSDKGKLAFFAIPDGQALARALDMVAKIQGAYAPTKNINLNVDVEATEEIKDLTHKLNEVYKNANSQNNGLVITDTGQSQ